MEFLLQPDVYKTGNCKTLEELLVHLWTPSDRLGKGDCFLISGFANYNGGVRFYSTFAKHIQDGGKVVAIVGGSTTQRLSSIQVVEKLLECGVEVHIINRKRLLHAKLYGYQYGDVQELIVTSGNFTGPGMSLNAEASLMLGESDFDDSAFSLDSLVHSIFNTDWMIYHLNKDDITDKRNAGWQLLYDEEHGGDELSEDMQTSMVMTLGHSDTVRINAKPNSDAYKGSQYFWLSKDAFGFFPALNGKNKRGVKNAYYCMINVNFIDLGRIEKVRVTYEAENNFDFRLGTGPLRGTNLASVEDLVIFSRVGEYDYELRLVRRNDPRYKELLRYAVTSIGGQGKMFGYVSNEDLKTLL